MSEIRLERGDHGLPAPVEPGSIKIRQGPAWGESLQREFRLVRFFLGVAIELP